MKGLQHLLWDARRFGFTPGKLRWRFRNQGLPRVIAISLPKSGTHLLERALCLHPVLYRKLQRTINDNTVHMLGTAEELFRRVHPGQILVAHLAYSPALSDTIAAAGLRRIFLMRDPRDIIVSQAFYIARKRSHPLHKWITSFPVVRSRLQKLIHGDEAVGLPSIRQRLHDYLGWMDGDNLSLRFEDLVGEDGGGTVARQRSVVARLFQYLDLPLPKDELERICINLFSDLSPTFRKGRAGGWKRYFDEDLEREFNDLAMDLSVRYGYGDKNTTAAVVSIVPRKEP